MIERFRGCGIQIIEHYDYVRAREGGRVGVGGEVNLRCTPSDPFAGSKAWADAISSSRRANALMVDQ